MKQLPYDKGLPFIGHTLAVIRDPVKWGQSMKAKHGKAFVANFLFEDTIFLNGPDALEWIWLDKTESFSAELAYVKFFGAITDTSLLLKDFTEHRIHRQALNPAFKTMMMEQYLQSMDAAIKSRLQEWGEKPAFKFYPAIKQLTLDVATEVFLGQQDKRDRVKVNKALTDILASALAVIRAPIFGTKYSKAQKAKKYINELLRTQIAAKRCSSGNDVFTKLCTEKNEDGTPCFSENEIIGHLITFWVAGHDTLASSLSTLVYQLGKNTDWQDKLREEVNRLRFNGQAPSMRDIQQLKLCEYAFNEALRMMPPALHTPRVALKDTTFDGYAIPAGHTISVGLYGIHHDPDHWYEPEEFNPARFDPANKVSGQHRYAWAPFGGGAHKCIGLVFAQLQAKIFLIYLLKNHQIKLPVNYTVSTKMFPTPRPADGLPIVLESITK